MDEHDTPPLSRRQMVGAAGFGLAVAAAAGPALAQAGATVPPPQISEAAL